MIDQRINSIQQMQRLETVTPLAQKGEKGNNEVSFSEMMKKYVQEANDLQVNADTEVRKVIAGEEVDAHEVMTAVEKANISFEMVMEIRNKMLDAYRELMKTQM